MTYPNHLKFTALVIFFASSILSLASGITRDSGRPNNDQLHQVPFECEEIEVKLDITHTTGSQPNGKIVMDFKNSSTSYTSFIFSGDSENNRLEVKDNEISNLGMGEYNLYIQDKNGCTKHIKFKIN